MLTDSFLEPTHRWTGFRTKALWCNIQAEGQVFSGPDHYVGQQSFSEQKPQEAKMKVKAAGLTWES